MVKSLTFIMGVVLATGSFTPLLNREHTAIGFHFPPNDTVIKKFNRHGLVYIDKMVRKKLVSRNVYLESILIYKYPVTQKNAGAGKIYLPSGNEFLSVGVVDTIQFSNYSLPVMNRHVFARGGTISRLSDSSYLIKANSKVGTFVTFVIAASDNYEEIKNRNNIIIDTLSLIVK